MLAGVVRAEIDALAFRTAKSREVAMLNDLSMLLVEDDADFAALLRAMLGALGVGGTVIHCETLQQAIDRIGEQRCDIALLDLMLPDSTGLATLHALHARAEDVAIVVLTAIDDDRLGAAAVAAGAQDYLCKRHLEPRTLGHLLRHAVVRKQLELRLLASERRYRTLFEDSLGLICIHDLDGVLVEVNPAAAAVLGYREQELCGLSLGTLLPAAHRSELPSYLRRVREHGSDAGRLILQTRSGETRIWQYRNRLVHAPGQVPQVLGVALDVTAQRRQESVLRARQAELEAVNDSSPLGLARLDARGLLLYANRTFERMTGRHSEALLGERWAEVVHPDDRARVIASWAEAVAGGGSYASWHRLQRADGTVVRVSVQAQPLRVDDRRLGYVASFEDVTARHEAEQALIASEGRLRTITDALPPMIGYGDSQQRFVYVNRAYELFYGQPRESIIGRHVREVLGEQRYAVRLPYLQRALGGERVCFEDSQERDGRVGAFEVTYIPQSDVAGQVVGVHFMVQDISVQKQESQRLRDLSEADYLTGLLNRAGLVARLQRALVRSADQRTLLAVFYLDMDGFKAINDRLGHGTGDLMLRAFADRLRDTVRASDVVARLGGDEFVVIAEGLLQPIIARTIAEKIVTAMREPFVVAGQSLEVTASVGVALCDDRAMDPQSLLDRADAMLYAAKRAGRDAYRIAPAGGPLPTG